VLPNAVAAEAIARFGPHELRDAWVGSALAGEAILTVAMTNDFGVPTIATKTDDGWAVNGGKTTVPAGTVADLFLVSVTSDSGDAMVVLVPREAPGLLIERQIVTNTQSEAHLTFQDVHVADVLGGGDVVQWLLDHLVVATCAHQLGVCERALELTAEYSKVRVQFDRPIATFQAVGQRLADAYIDVQAVRLTLWQAAWRLAEGLDCAAEIATAKFWASDAGHRVAHTAVHVHGGMGIDLDYHLHRYFTAAKRNEFAFGGATKPLVALGAQLANEPA
jgi:acyl-CoA dehydrogenase